MKVSIITEGDIDLVLLPPLIAAIAQEAGIRWPVDVKEDLHVSHIRKTGHGGALEKARQIAESLAKGTYPRPDLLVFVLDSYKTEHVIGEIKDLLAGHPWVVFGIAIQEIEAWWLGDRKQTLGWLGLTEETATECGYGPDYAPEKDADPKVTLNKLTEVSTNVDDLYGDGHTGLAEDFVSVAWSNWVDINSIKFKCNEGFGEFSERLSHKIGAAIPRNIRGQLVRAT